MALIATSDLLSLKPVIYAANTDEEGFTHLDANPYYQQVKAIADAEGAQVLPICARMEQDIAELEGEEKQMFLEELGVEESGLDRLIKCSYALLGLISFLTYGKDECRAWTIKRGPRRPRPPARSTPGVRERPGIVPPSQRSAGPPTAAMGQKLTVHGDIIARDPPNVDRGAMMVWHALPALQACALGHGSGNGKNSTRSPRCIAGAKSGFTAAPGCFFSSSTSGRGVVAADVKLHLAGGCLVHVQLRVDNGLPVPDGLGDIVAVGIHHDAAAAPADDLLQPGDLIRGSEDPGDTCPGEIPCRS